MSTGFSRVLRAGAAIAAATLLPGVPAPAETPAYPAQTVLLFVAGWCAPCQGELQQLAQISAAARPFRVLVVPVDRGRRVERMLESVPVEQRWRPDGQAWAQVQSDLLSGTAGLPYSVAIAADGRPCAATRRGLDKGSAAELVARCSRNR